MRSAPVLFIVLLILLMPACALAEKSAVLVIVDGMGAAYLYPDLSAECVDGTDLGPVALPVVNEASARFTLKVPVPETEFGHAVLVTGYSGADGETLTYYDATIFDSLRKDGYLCMGVMETGDSASMVREVDAIVHDSANSVTAPDFQYSVNSQAVPAGVQAVLTSGQSRVTLPGKKSVDSYRLYNDWSIGRAVDLVHYMNSSCPDQKYLLTVNVAGTDMVAHEKGFDAYSSTVAGLQPGLAGLVETCRKYGIILVVTADHGMSFKSTASRGSHASEDVAGRNESLLIPFLIFTDEAVGANKDVYGQQCVAPTLLSLMGCPNHMSMCDGEPLPWNERPALQLESGGPVNATISGPWGFKKTVMVNGTLLLCGLEQGDYRVESGGHVQVVSLSHDTIVQIVSSTPPQSKFPAFALFLGSGVLAAAGIAAAMVRQR